MISMFLTFCAAIFRSLLYEACGRMLNPVYGSVVLLWSGNCAAGRHGQAVPPLRSCDIGHVATSPGSQLTGSTG